MARLSAERTVRHIVLASLVLVVGGLVVQFGPGDLVDNLSIATAWLCLVAMAGALSLGPLRARRAGAPTLNLQLRRDLGIWSGLTGLGHLVLATIQSMSQRYMTRYVEVDLAGLDANVRAMLFAWGSIIGFLIGLVLLLLLGLSNNRVMHRLGPKRWKRLQRLVYPVFALTLIHGLAYQLLELRSAYLIAVLVAIAGAIVILQILGRRAVRAAR